MTDSIHGVKTYIDYKYEFNWMTILAFLPLCYIFPTIYVMIKVCYCHIKAKSGSVNPHVTLQMTLFYIMNICFFFADYMRLYLPMSGLFTSWCASVAPNHYLKVIFMLSFYFQYCVGFLLFLMSATRLILLTAHPSMQDVICKRLTMFAIPSVFIIPFFMTFWMLPALGYCRSMGGAPLPEGSVSIYYYGTWFGARNTPFHLTFCTTMCSACLITSAFILRKLRRTKKAAVSEKTKKIAQRAENALSLTMMISFLPFLSGSLQTVITYSNQQNIVYMMVFRPFGSDCEAVIIPWVMFFTSPLLKKASAQPALSASRKASVFTSTTSITKL